MTTVTMPYAPLADSLDPVSDAFVTHRTRLLTGFAQVMRARFGQTATAHLARELERCLSCDRPARLELLLQPAFNHWWFELCQSFSRGEPAGVLRLLEELERSPERWRSAADPLAGSSVTVAGHTPWVERFLNFVNPIDPPPGAHSWQLVHAPCSAQDLAHLESSLHALSSAWPSMAAEVERNVRVIVPFATPHSKRAFTHTAIFGAVFLGDQFTDEAFTIERLVHETSHLRLNMFMAVEPLHRHDPAETMASPFRRGQRPINGIYHGVFVFLRIADTMARAFATLRMRGSYERAKEALALVDSGLALLRERVRLTPAGSSLYEQMQDRARTLALEHGVGAS